jgi:hypothetical protein
MNTIRRIHLNPQSKGNLGKSFEAEFRAAWLDRLGVPWNGSDLDDRHHTFANRHPEIVRSYQLGNEQESKAELLTLFRRVLKDAAPVHIVDTRAQADALILTALEELQVLDVCAEQGVRLTFFLFPTDDTESMNNVGKLFLYGGDGVDYVIVHNPAKARGDLFKNSQLEKRLLDYGAKTVTLLPDECRAQNLSRSRKKHDLALWFVFDLSRLGPRPKSQFPDNGVRRCGCDQKKSRGGRRGGTSSLGRPSFFAFLRHRSPTVVSQSSHTGERRRGIQRRANAALWPFRFSNLPFS